jgi:3-dehydroquinate synthetase
VWTEAVGRAVAVKARLVEADERDVGVRRQLNYGHTVGHALERLLGNDRLRHGEAIAIGMAVAARMARARGLVDAAWVRDQDADLQRLDLPRTRPAGLAASEVLAALGVDKKRRPGLHHVFALPAAAGGIELLEDVRDDEIAAAWEATPGAAAGSGSR